MGATFRPALTPLGLHEPGTTLRWRVAGVTLERRQLRMSCASCLRLAFAHSLRSFCTPFARQELLSAELGVYSDRPSPATRRCIYADDPQDPEAIPRGRPP